MSANPSSRWFWNDWDNDRGLQLCSLAAQGLWMRMLSIAARADGYVRVGERACSPEDIAILVGKPAEEVEELIAELGARGVFSRNRHGTIYSRRMLRDSKRSKVNAKNGKMGGNPNLLKQTEKPESVKPQPSAMPSPLYPIDPIPKKEEDSFASLRPPADPTKEVFDRGVAMLGKARRSLLGKFCKQHGEVAVLEALIATEEANTVDPVSYFVGCMSRAPPKNGQANGHDKDSPVTKLYKGAYRAAERIIERDRLAAGGQADSSLDLPPPLTLLDR